MNDQEKQGAVEIRNRIMDRELAGVVRYTHYALMVYGYNRIPIVPWLKSNADENRAHAHKAGGFVTLSGGHPPLKIGTLLETEKHDVGDILLESLEWQLSGQPSRNRSVCMCEAGAARVILDHRKGHRRFRDADSGRLWLEAMSYESWIQHARWQLLTLESLGVILCVYLTRVLGFTKKLLLEGRSFQLLP